MGGAEDLKTLSNNLGAGLIFGCTLDGRGGCTPVSDGTAIVSALANSDRLLWLHIDRTAPGLEAWLQAALGLSHATIEVLLSNETRPRAFRDGDGLVTVLRGINLNSGAEPVDMIAMQIWAETGRVVTFRRRRLQTPRDVLKELEDGAGPRTAGELVARLMQLLVAKMSQTIVALNGQIDAMEDGATTADPEALLGDIADVRRSCLALKRHMSPQYEALAEVQRVAPEWLTDDDRHEVRETLERLRRYLDDLDVSKESALVLQDELNNRASNRMNQKMYMLAIVAAIFLPLSFVTGLLGINVGGMPGVNSTVAFWVTVGVLAVLMTLQYFIFRRLKWI